MDVRSCDRAFIAVAETEAETEAEAEAEADAVAVAVAVLIAGRAATIGTPMRCRWQTGWWALCI